MLEHARYFCTCPSKKENKKPNTIKSCDQVNEYGLTVMNTSYTDGTLQLCKFYIKSINTDDILCNSSESQHGY